MLFRILILLISLFSSFAQPAFSYEESEFDLKLVDVANKYTASVLAAKLCGEFNFNGKAEKSNFISNMDLSKIYAMNVFLRRQPNVSREIILARAESLDKVLSENVNQFYAEKGCSHELIKSFRRWFATFKKLPKFPYPKPDPEVGDDFLVMGMVWLAANEVK
ncbi:hypothetical protein [Phyllobacterium sp. K27]